MNVLLRIVDDAKVALVKEGIDPELLPTRYDLYQYRGGIAWGYKGSGVMNLAYAIVARLFEDSDKTPSEIEKAAISMVEKLLCDLSSEREHELTEEQLLHAIETK